MEIVGYLLNHREDKGRYILSEKFLQDPLENYFGKQRMKGGRNEGRQECREAGMIIRLQRNASKTFPLFDCKGH